MNKTEHLIGSSAPDKRQTNPYSKAEGLRVLGGAALGVAAGGLLGAKGAKVIGNMAGPSKMSRGERVVDGAIDLIDDPLALIPSKVFLPAAGGLVGGAVGLHVGNATVKKHPGGRDATFGERRESLQKQAAELATLNAEQEAKLKKKKNTQNILLGTAGAMGGLGMMAMHKKASDDRDKALAAGGVGAGVAAGAASLHADKRNKGAVSNTAHLVAEGGADLRERYLSAKSAPHEQALENLSSSRGGTIAEMAEKFDAREVHEQALDGLHAKYLGNNGSHHMDEAEQFLKKTKHLGRLRAGLAGTGVAGATYGVGKLLGKKTERQTEEGY